MRDTSAVRCIHAQTFRGRNISDVEGGNQTFAALTMNRREALKADLPVWLTVA